MQDAFPKEYTSCQPFKTAVLFLIFNRLNTTQQVFEAIRRVKPCRLYVAADGPRTSKSGESEKVHAVRDYVLKHIDWNCDIKTLFREKNMGCKFAVSSAIDWFFQHEEKGIILEDDCLPSTSFFPFCEELLTRYVDDHQVMHISGFNPLAFYPMDTSYCFSRFGPIWGWASWRRAWQYYDVNMSSWPEKRSRLIRDGIVHSKAEMRWRRDIFDKVYHNQLDTWDYQWSYARHIHCGLSIIPRVNLVSNIGFSTDSTHTSHKAPDHFLLRYELNFPLSHPLSVHEDEHLGDLYLEHFALPRKQRLLAHIGLLLRNDCKGIYRRRKKWNVILDEKIHPVENLTTPKEESCDQTSDSFWQWLGKAQSAFLKYRYPHKKALEFFFSAKLLDIQPNDIVLDAAGGRSEYLSQIRWNTNCQNLYLNDQIYAGHSVEGNGIKIVGGDVTAMALPDSSVTKIACHHAIEHFQNDKDIKFVLEVARLLRRGGKACIIPLFLTDIYAEIWNIKPKTHYDARAMTFEDKSASLPGGNDDGHFARVYDLQALTDRIIQPAVRSFLSVKIVRCTLDGMDIPDMVINFGTKINRPLRALVLEKM